MMMAAAAMVLAACGNDDESDDWAGEIRLSSGLEVQQGTRATTDIQTTQFDSEAKIDVFIKENVTEGQTATTTYAQPLVYTAGGNGIMIPATQPYFPSSGNGVNIYAYYPSGKVGNDITATSFSFSVAENQSEDKDYKASDLMYGEPRNNPVIRTSKSTPLTFKHLLSKVTIELKSGSGAPDLTDAVVKLKSVLPSTTLDVSKGTISAASGNAKEIIVKGENNSSLSGSAIVVPQTLETTFIEVTLKEGGVLTSKDLTDSRNEYIESVILESGYEYKYTITVNLTSLDVTSNITRWNNKTETTGNAEM